MADHLTDPVARSADASTDQVGRLAAGELHDPHALLGWHGGVLRAWLPGAASVRVVGGAPLGADGPDGMFTGPVASAPRDGAVYEVTWPDGHHSLEGDPYGHWPTLGDLDLHLIGQGRHRRMWEVLGADAREHGGVRGAAFSVWAPAARSVRVVGDWNGWSGRRHPMRALGSSGVWEIFVPGVAEGARYKFEVVGADGSVVQHADPMAQRTELPPSTASLVTARSSHQWSDEGWLAARAKTDPQTAPMSVYEVHVGSWRRVPEEGNRMLTWDELAAQLPAYVADLGFTHVELMPPTEHPYGPSWGYQCTSYFAPTARHGDPDGFRRLVDAFHAVGVGVIVDWVPAHFPKDAWALARFDGTALYEHADPRQGEHPDWGTLVFNLGRNEVRGFLIASALYWLDELHCDGLRVDAVASMLYLDYSRSSGEWVPNALGGRENLEAVSFLQELNTEVHALVPGACTLAEESTSWPGVSKPVYEGGLGFTFKWNMGWMHDTLEHLEREPVHRRHHQEELTFGLLYAFSEHFMLPLSHDEVVHGKGSLIEKLPGDRWCKHATLRALYAWMWAHPGKKLLFMGGELAQPREWSEARSLDWHLLHDPAHAAIHDLVRTLNVVARDEPALWQVDDRPAGFSWIDASDAASSVLAFLRWSEHRARTLACIANFTPVVRGPYRVGVPVSGRWVEVVNTDAVVHGGSGIGNLGSVVAEEIAMHGQPCSIELTLPPLGVLWLVPEAQAPRLDTTDAPPT